MISHFEHFMSFVADNDLRGNMQRWQRAGFSVPPRTVRHSPGLENGFVQLTGTYLEFLTIADFEKFNRTKWEPYQITQKKPRVVGAAMYATNPFLVNRKWRKIFPDLKPCYSAGPADAPERREWLFTTIPRATSPGLYVFGIRPLVRHVPPYAPTIGQNTIFGVVGIIFCSPHASEKKSHWLKHYRDYFRGIKELSDGFANTGQRLRWITPERYDQIFKEPWPQLPGDYYDCAALVLGASDPSVAFKLLTAEGFRCH